MSVHDFKPSEADRVLCAVCGFPYDQYNLHPRPVDELTAARAEAQQAKKWANDANQVTLIWERRARAAEAEAQQAKRERDELMNLQTQYAIDNRLALDAAEAEVAHLRSELTATHNEAEMWHMLAEVSSVEHDACHDEAAHYRREELQREAADLRRENEALREALEMMLDRTNNPITDHAFYTLEDARTTARDALALLRGTEAGTTVPEA